MSVSVNTKIIDPARELKKVQVGKDQEKAQSEKDSHSKNRGGKADQAQRLIHVYWLLCFIVTNAINL